MNDFVNKWFPPGKPNLAAKYESDFIPPTYAYKKSMDRLKEIDRKLDLLHEYLAYRAEWLIRWKGHKQTWTYYLDEIGCIPIYDDNYPYGHILDFDDWIKIRDKYTALALKAIGA